MIPLLTTMTQLPKNLIPIPFVNKNEITAYEKILLNGRNIIGNIAKPYKAGETVVISHDSKCDIIDVIHNNDMRMSSLFIGGDTQVYLCDSC